MPGDEGSVGEERGERLKMLSWRRKVDFDFDFEEVEMMDAVGVGEEGVGSDCGDSVRVGVSTEAVSGRGANLMRRVGVGALALR
jgi:hypothetical protein